MRKQILGATILLFGLNAYAENATYDKMCKSCHGADGKGVAAKVAMLKIDAKKLDLGAIAAGDATKDKFKEAILKGKEKMPSYEKKLKAEEVDPLVDYTVDLASKARGK